MFFIPRGDIWNYTAYWEKVQIFEPKENVLPNCVTRFKELYDVRVKSKFCHSLM